MRRSVLCTVFLLGLLHAGPASAVSIGLTDTFEDGTTQNWLVNLLGMGPVPNPAPPLNIPTGGPAGLDDNFLQLTSLGGGGAGSRLVAINPAQWAGNYTGAGVTGISMDLKNLGATELAVRLYLENPVNAPPTDDAVSDAVILPAGSDWTSVFFPIAAADLTALTGNVDTLLSNVTILRIIQNPVASFPPPSIVGVLGVDNIQAVPEPGIAPLLLLAGAVAGAVRWRRVRKPATL